MAKISKTLISTVLDEENAINGFLDSVLRQSEMPGEIVIVDGGSNDHTVANIKYKILNIKYKERFKVIVKKGNRSVGRNAAIKNSTGDIISVSDVGCILDQNWFKNITSPFENKKIDVVAGFYKPKSNSIFEKCLATYTCTMADRVDPNNFLPSSRSVAFRKSAWEKVGGYPEELDTCEDLIFDQKLKVEGFNFRFAKNAIVYWPQRKNISQAFKQFLHYAIGDGQAFYIRPQTPFLFARYILAAALVGLYFVTKSNLLLSIIYSLLSAYIVWSVWKNYKYVNHLKAFLYLPVLQIISDAAVLSGMTIGFFKSLMR